MNKHLNRNPHYVDDHCWWYEDDKGINVVLEREAFAGTCQAAVIRHIDWRTIRAALKRKDRKE